MLTELSSQNFVAGGSQSGGQPNGSVHHDSEQRSFNSFTKRESTRPDGLRSNFLPATANEPDFRSFEEAEDAFMKLLRRLNIQATSSWEDTVRACVKDPQYRAIRDPKDRKAAFEKYVVETRAQEKEREKERIAKLRDDFTTMLKSHPEIKRTTRWKTALPIIEGETIFRSTGDDTERHQLFDEYVQQLRIVHAETQIANRKAARGNLLRLLRSLDFDRHTKWPDAQRRIESNEQFLGDDKFRALTKTDVLTAFEEQIVSIQQVFSDARHKERSRRGRVERQNRDRYIALLHQLNSERTIKAGTKWKDVLPMLEDDERYVAMLGQPGSTPMDLFWDIVEQEEKTLRAKRSAALDVLDVSHQSHSLNVECVLTCGQDKQYEVTLSTSLEQFMSVMQSDPRTKVIHEDDLRLIFERLLERIARRKEEEEYYAERKQRKAVDALRSRIKRLEPPIRASDTWEVDVLPRVSKYEEYRALDNDELARSAFEKVVKRLREHDEGEEEQPRRRDRHESRSNGHRRSREDYSRSPELDVYEADRRRAIAARERQYRKSSTTGLSPPPREYSPRDYSPRRRDRYDRRDDFTRNRLPPSRYDRRGGDMDSEYVSRMDPKGAFSKPLDYGEDVGRAGSLSGSSLTRRRRNSTDDGDEYANRDSKRHKQRSPEEETEIKEEQAMRSGSEEGEIKVDDE